ncbi:hypothetical protein GF324_08695, partial [bacterium]|nr:hypothetical protein [bacterium]
MLQPSAQVDNLFTAALTHGESLVEKWKAERLSSIAGFEKLVQDAAETLQRIPSDSIDRSAQRSICIGLVRAFRSRLQEQWTPADPDLSTTQSQWNKVLDGTLIDIEESIHVQPDPGEWVSQAPAGRIWKGVARLRNPLKAASSESATESDSHASPGRILPLLQACRSLFEAPLTHEMLGLSWFLEECSLSYRGTLGQIAVDLGQHAGLNESGGALDNRFLPLLEAARQSLRALRELPVSHAEHARKGFLSALNRIREHHEPFLLYVGYRPWPARRLKQEWITRRTQRATYPWQARHADLVRTSQQQAGEAQRKLHLVLISMQAANLYENTAVRVQREFSEVISERISEIIQAVDAMREETFPAQSREKDARIDREAFRTIREKSNLFLTEMRHRYQPTLLDVLIQSAPGQYIHQYRTSIHQILQSVRFPLQNRATQMESPLRLSDILVFEFRSRMHSTIERLKQELETHQGRFIQAISEIDHLLAVNIDAGLSLTEQDEWEEAAHVLKEGLHRVSDHLSDTAGHVREVMDKTTHRLKQQALEWEASLHA